MEIETYEWAWFMPKFDGNREAAEPCAVELRRPTCGWIQAELAKVGNDVAKVQQDATLIPGNIRAVRGLTWRGRPVTTGEELWALFEDAAPKFAPLFHEIRAAIVSGLGLDDDTKKNSPSPSGSPDSLAKIDGIAESAAAMVST
jgi:hypothetical protein